MKRLFILLVLLAFVIGISMYNPATALDKVQLCHQNPDGDDDPALTEFVIEVAPPAVPAHLAHGDWIIEDNSGVVGEACPAS